MTDTVQLGQKVPDFELKTFEPSTGGFGEYSLEQNRKDGKWSVLVFYPADFTFVCATEFAALAKHQDAFAELDARVCTVSNDTEFVHLAWQREEKQLAGVEYSMGADPTGRVGKLFGVLDEDSGLTLRGTFVIDPHGVLVASEVNFYNVGRNMDELLRKFKASRHVSEQPDEVCPASWEEGGKTLKPGPDLVGRVDQALNG